MQGCGKSPGYQLYRSGLVSVCLTGARSASLWIQNVRKRARVKWFPAVSIFMVLFGANFTPAQESSGNQASQIAWTLSDAPRAVATGAAVITMSDDGKIEELQKGEIGWTA